MTVARRTRKELEQEIVELLAAYELPVAPRRFLALVRQALRSVVTDRPGDHAATALTSAEARELSAVGLDGEASSGAYAGAVQRTAAKMTAILADSRGVPEVAELLGVTPARVRQMLNTEQSLFGIKAGNAWQVPSFQFVGDRPVPNMRSVLGALPRDLHAVEFFNWFTRPDPALRIDDRPVSPRDWLASGGDPEPVAAEAAQL